MACTYLDLRLTQGTIKKLSNHAAQFYSATLRCSRCLWNNTLIASIITYITNCVIKNKILF